jgi:hypothetical protein
MAGDFEPPSSAEVSRVQMHTIQQPKGHLPCTAVQGRASWHHKLSCNSSPIVSSHINHKALTARCFTLAALTQHFVEHLQTPHTHSVLYFMVQHQGNGLVGQLLTHDAHIYIAVAHWMISESETKPLLKGPSHRTGSQHAPCIARLHVNTTALQVPTGLLSQPISTAPRW